MVKLYRKDPDNYYVISWRLYTCACLVVIKRLEFYILMRYAERKKQTY